MKKKSWTLAYVLGSGALGLFCVTSCASLEDGAAVRHEQIQGFQREQSQRASWLEQPRDLRDCLSFALANNYGLRLAALERRLAELDVSTSLAEFMPTVKASCGWEDKRRIPTAGGMQTSGRHYTDGGVSVDLPIFDPATWLLYANMKLERENKVLSQHIARQAIVSQVTILYYRCIVGELKLDTLKTQIEATKSQLERVNALMEEGQVQPWEKTLAETQYQSKVIAFSQAQRELQITRGEMLQALGLSAVDAGKLTLKRPPLGSKTPIPGEPVLERVLTALAKRPEMSIQDRQMVMADNNVRTAIAEFLPSVDGFLSGTWTTDSVADQANNLIGGLSGSLDLFKGFSKVSSYKRSKVGMDAMALQRDQLSLAIILEVMKADADVKNSDDDFQLARLAFVAAAGRHEDKMSRYGEGLVPLHEMLDARAEMDEAQLAMVTYQFVQEIYMTNLSLAMGTLVPDEAVKTAEDEKYPAQVDVNQLLIKE